MTEKFLSFWSFIKKLGENLCFAHYAKLIDSKKHDTSIRENFGTKHKTEISQHKH